MMKLVRSVFTFKVDSYEKSKMNIIDELLNEINNTISAENIINVQMHTDYESIMVRDKEDRFEHAYFPGRVWMEVYHRVPKEALKDE